MNDDGRDLTTLRERVRTLEDKLARGIWAIVGIGGIFGISTISSILYGSQKAANIAYETTKQYLESIGLEEAKKNIEKIQKLRLASEADQIVIRNCIASAKKSNDELNVILSSAKYNKEFDTIKVESTKLRASLEESEKKLESLSKTIVALNGTQNQYELVSSQNLSGLKDELKKHYRQFQDIAREIRRELTSNLDGLSRKTSTLQEELAEGLKKIEMLQFVDLVHNAKHVPAIRNGDGSVTAFFRGGIETWKPDPNGWYTIIGRTTHKE